MVIVGSRRTLLSVAASTTLIASDPNHPKQPPSLPEIIRRYTPESFRQAVATSGRLMYRGETSIDGFEVLAPEPDLLLPDTYNDPDALAYFQCLERRLCASKTEARPSTGHIATSDVSEASQWGDAVSVWPLGTSISYVWPKQNKCFSPSAEGCPKDELVINQELEMALALGHEVLFSCSFDDGRMPSMVPGRSQSAFLAVSARYEKELMDAIMRPEFFAAV